MVYPLAVKASLEEGVFRCCCLFCLILGGILVLIIERFMGAIVSK